MNNNNMMFQQQDHFLQARFVFTDFRTAWAFMTEVAFEAEISQHHPNWENVYNQVVIKLTTHDAGNTVTEKDYKLAAHIEKIAQKYLHK
jgi:4a-hydroxytetrahydrobiopterin dehydratase